MGEWKWDPIYVSTVESGEEKEEEKEEEEEEKKSINSFSGCKVNKGKC